MIFLFLAWLIWGGLVAQNVLTQNAKNQKQLQVSRLQSQGQMLEWFFQERTLQIKSWNDDEPVVSRYNSEQWKNLEPWKGQVFIKGQEAHLYGAFDKMMPETHQKQLTQILKNLLPSGKIEGVHWEAFQWNGSAFIVAYVTRPSGSQGFFASASDWGRSLSLLSEESGWSLANHAGNLIFHSDTRYIGEKITSRQTDELSKTLATTNLIARLTPPETSSTRGLALQLTLITVGLGLISGFFFHQILKNERVKNSAHLQALQEKLILQKQELQDLLSKAPPPPPSESQTLVLKDLSHRVATSLGRQLHPALSSALAEARWLASVSEDRSKEEKASLEKLTEETKSAKNILDKVLMVSGDHELERFPMKLETPVLRVLKKWEMEFQHQNVIVEKVISDTSFFPLNSEALEKALGHMIQNSLESMARKLDKKLRVEIYDEGETLRLAIEDNGIGIEGQHLKSIGDPFFTTKTHQNRLGLGLTEAFGIFKQHHAVVSVTSDIGQGTRFEIRFDKNAAQTLMVRPSPLAPAAFSEGFIEIPKDLPVPLEAQTSETHDEVVDEEIEKLLEIADGEFQEAPVETIVTESSVAVHEDFLDENPMRGQDA